MKEFIQEQKAIVIMVVLIAVLLGLLIGYFATRSSSVLEPKQPEPNVVDAFDRARDQMGHTYRSINHIFGDPVRVVRHDNNHVWIIFEENDTGFLFRRDIVNSGSLEQALRLPELEASAINADIRSQLTSFSLSIRSLMDLDKDYVTINELRETISNLVNRSNSEIEQREISPARDVMNLQGTYRDFRARIHIPMDRWDIVRIPATTRVFFVPMTEDELW